MERAFPEVEIRTVNMENGVVNRVALLELVAGAEYDGPVVHVVVVGGEVLVRDGVEGVVVEHPAVIIHRVRVVGDVGEAAGQRVLRLAKTRPPRCQSEPQ